jgi:PadR family transcriptional regulator, regulatory protein PadR
MTEKPLTIAAIAVLKAIAEGVRYGFDIMDATSLPSGSVYPILGRLENAGYVRSRWEKDARAHRAGRPARRLYQITPSGSRALTAAIEHYRTLGGMLPGAPAPRPSSA